MSKFNSNPTFDSVNAGSVYLNDLYIRGSKFVNLDQEEMDLIIQNLGNITQNAAQIAALQQADIIINGNISSLQTDVGNLKGNVSIIQGNISTINSNINIIKGNIISLEGTNLSLNQKTQWWNADGSIYNNTGANGGISGIFANVLVQLGGGHNSMLQVGGSTGITLEANNGVAIRGKSESDVKINVANTNNSIEIGLDTEGGYGTSKIIIGGGESVIRIGQYQSPTSLTTGPKIYIGQKHDIVADSDTVMAGNFQTNSAQFVDLHTTSLITWDNLLALYDVPFSISTMPYWMIWAISSLIPNYVYSDCVKMKRNALYEKYGEIDTSNRLDLESLNIFNTSIVNPLNNVFTTFSLYGGCSMSTMNGTHRLYALTGGVELRCDGGIVDWITTEDTHDTNRVFVGTSEVSMTASKSSTNITIQSLHSGTAINFYNNNSINGYSSTKKLTMSMLDDNNIVVRGNTAYNGYPMTINSTGISGEKGLAIQGNVGYNTTITTTNVGVPSLTLNTAYSGIVGNTLYRDSASNLYWNGKNISAPVASTANTYILTINGNSTTPPVSTGSLITSYTSTPGYYIEKSAYTVNTEYEMGTFTSGNIDLSTNPIIPDGIWDLNFYHSYNGNETVNAYFKIFVESTLKVSPFTVSTTLIADGSTSPIPLKINGTTGTYTILENQVFVPLYQFPDLLNYNYKILVKQYFKQPTGNTNAHVVRFAYNNDSLTHLHSTLNTGGGITAIPTLQQVLTSGASANSIGITNLDSISGSNNADVFYSATGGGQLSLNAAGSTKLRVGSSGITATSNLDMNANDINNVQVITSPNNVDMVITGQGTGMVGIGYGGVNGVKMFVGPTYNSQLQSIHMNNYNIEAANIVKAATFTGGSGGKIVCHPSSDETTIGKFLNPLDAGGYSLYTQSIKCNGAITAAGFYLGNEVYKPLDWDWQGTSKASLSSSYWVQWDSVLDSLPTMSLSYDWELELRFRNYATTTDYIGILYNGQTAGNTPTIYGYYGHETKQYASSTAGQAFVNNHCFSKVLNRNVDYQDHIYRLRLCWDARNNVLVNYTKGVCYRWGNGTGASISDYTQDEGAQVYTNTSYLQEVSGTPPSITSIRFQSYTTTIDIFRSATLRVKRVAKRWT